MVIIGNENIDKKYETYTSYSDILKTSLGFYGIIPIQRFSGMAGNDANQTVPKASLETQTPLEF